MIMFFLLLHRPSTRVVCVGVVHMGVVHMEVAQKGVAHMGVVHMVHTYVWSSI